MGRSMTYKTLLLKNAHTDVVTNINQPRGRDSNTKTVNSFLQKFKPHKTKDKGL